MDAVRNNLSAWNRDDLDGVLATMDPDIEFHTSDIGHGDLATVLDRQGAVFMLFAGQVDP